MAIPNWGQKMAIAFAVVFFTTIGLNTSVQADGTGTVGETINNAFDPGRERGEHASSIAPPSKSEPISILDFVQNHKDQHDDEDQHDDD